VIGVSVCKEHRIDATDVVLERLVAQVRTCVDEDNSTVI
jgi:hypothetical protein